MMVEELIATIELRVKIDIAKMVGDLMRCDDGFPEVCDKCLAYQNVIDRIWEMK